MDGYVLELKPSITSVFISPVIITLLLACLGVYLKVKIIEKQRSDKFNCLSDMLTKVDYWYHNGSSAMGVDVSSKKIALISSNKKELLISLDDIIELESTISIPDVCYTNSVQITHSGQVIESQDLGHYLADKRSNENQHNKALRNTGLIFNLDLLENPTMFITMRKHEIPSWNRLIKHLSENKLSSKSRPHFFPED